MSGLCRMRFFLIVLPPFCPIFKPKVDITLLSKKILKNMDKTVDKRQNPCYNMSTQYKMIDEGGL